MKKNINKIFRKIKEKIKNITGKINNKKEVIKIKELYKKYKKELEIMLILISYIFIYYNLFMLSINAGLYLWYKGFDFLVFSSIIFYIGLLLYTTYFKFKSPYKVLAMVLVIEILI